jgi:IS30 family transposase
MAKQLTLAQRYHIAVRLSEGKMQKDIAEKIGTSRSTLTRELQRNGGHMKTMTQSRRTNALSSSGKLPKKP